MAGTREESKKRLKRIRQAEEGGREPGPIPPDARLVGPFKDGRLVKIDDRNTTVIGGAADELARVIAKFTKKKKKEEEEEVMAKKNKPQANPVKAGREKASSVRERETQGR